MVSVPSPDAPDRTLKMVVRLDTVAFGLRRFIDRQAQRREAARRARAEEAQRSYRPSRYRLVERSLLAALIGIACIVSIGLLGPVISHLFDTVGKALGSNP